MPNTTFAPGHPSGTARLGSARRPFTAFLQAWSQRRALARLDSHLLRDIGLSEHDVAAETAKPLWVLPPTL